MILMMVWSDEGCDAEDEESQITGTYAMLDRDNDGIMSMEAASCPSYICGNIVSHHIILNLVMCIASYRIESQNITSHYNAASSSSTS